MGWIPAAIGAAGSIGGGLLNLFSQQGQQGLAREQLDLARQQLADQRLLAQLQIQMTAAPRTDARGNTVFYNPATGWETNLSPMTRGIVNASDAVAKDALVQQLTRGAGERSAAFNRRLTEGSAADPLLQAVMNNYGGPTKAGVAGKDAIAGVTAASEQGDALRRGYSGAALRTGSGTLPLASNLAQIDKGTTSGIRTALAKSQANADPLFQAQLQQFQQGKLSPYGALRASSANSTDLPFQPETSSNPVDTTMLSASTYGPRNVSGAGESLYRGIVPALTAYNAQKPVNYDLFAAGLGKSLEELLRKTGWGGGGSTPEYNTGWTSNYD